VGSSFAGSQCSIVNESAVAGSVVRSSMVGGTCIEEVWMWTLMRSRFVVGGRRCSSPHCLNSMDQCGNKQWDWRWNGDCSFLLCTTCKTRIYNDDGLNSLPCSLLKKKIFL